jgi:hypothetical protein
MLSYLVIIIVKSAWIETPPWAEDVIVRCPQACFVSVRSPVLISAMLVDNFRSHLIERI